MPYVTKPVDTYVLYYLSSSGGGPQVGVPQLAEIDCFSRQAGRSGILYFFPNGASLPPNANTINGIYIYYHLSQFNDVITILREEKPLTLWFNEDNKVAYVATSSESIGQMIP